MQDQRCAGPHGERCASRGGDVVGFMPPETGGVARRTAAAVKIHEPRFKTQGAPLARRGEQRFLAARVAVEEECDRAGSGDAPGFEFDALRAREAVRGEGEALGFGRAAILWARVGWAGEEHADLLARGKSFGIARAHAFGRESREGSCMPPGEGVDAEEGAQQPTDQEARVSPRRW